ncbi:MAG: HsdM family class I SAM-dependent methyltransferase, partial [Peptostreptococcaceae bacterium]
MKYDLGVLEIDNFYLSKKYEQELDDEKRKLNGIYYTPKIIVDYIMFKTLKEHDIVENPYLKILDFSCGCGNFLLEAYYILYALFEENIESLNKKYKDEYWCIDNIHEHIIENCIYGVDIDAEALELLKNSLYQKNDKECDNYQFNIYCEDGLKKKWEFKFDYIVGNPPYIGHKLLNKEYKKYLLKEYKEVYKDKSDLYFCFYKKAIDIIKDDGLICMITPRYFLQSPSGTYLRTYIKEKMHIKEIVDFLGTEVFKSVGIASCILTLKNEKENKINNINILKIKNESLKINEYEKLDYLLEENFENYKFNQSLLNEDWLIANEEDKKFYDNIEGKCICYLGDIVNSFQGIITGCDKAFIINKSNEHIGCIPQSILKVWIKNKNIKKYTINDSELRLIYSNDLDY